MNERLLSPFFRLLLAASALSLPFLFAGCAGYQLGENKPAAYSDIENIYVPTFQNETLEPRLSVLVTNAVITQLQQDGTYKITNKEDADAVLVGTIRQVPSLPTTVHSNRSPQNTRIVGDDPDRFPS